MFIHSKIFNDLHEIIQRKYFNDISIKLDKKHLLIGYIL